MAPGGPGGGKATASPRPFARRCASRRHGPSLADDRNVVRSGCQRRHRQAGRHDDGGASVAVLNRISIRQ
jgi:hypothetical protein